MVRWLLSVWPSFPKIHPWPPPSPELVPVSGVIDSIKVRFGPLLPTGFANGTSWPQNRRQGEAWVFFPTALLHPPLLVAAAFLQIFASGQWPHLLLGWECSTLWPCVLWPTDCQGVLMLASGCTDIAISSLTLPTPQWWFFSLRSLNSDDLEFLGGTPAHTNYFKLFYEALEHPEFQNDLEMSNVCG